VPNVLVIHLDQKLLSGLAHRPDRLFYLDHLVIDKENENENVK